MEEIYHQIDGFIQSSLQERVLYSLRLDCHASIAFAAGYMIGTKSGFEVAPVQKTISGQSIWRTKGISKSLPDLWSITDHRVSERDDEIGIAISITHSIAADVAEYVNRSLPSISRIVAFQLLMGISSNAIEDGEHAYILVQQIIQWLNQNRTRSEKEATLHIFGSAPNGFMFYFGQHAKILGPIQLYEHDFDNPAKSNYQASLKFPKR